MNDNNFGEPSGGDFIDTHFDFTRCQRPDGSHYGTGGVCRLGAQTGAKEKDAPSARTQNRLDVEAGKAREAKMNSAKEKRDASKDLKNRRGETVGTSPRNMMIDNRDAMQKRLDGSKVEAERKILKEAIGKIDKKLASDKSEGVSMKSTNRATKEAAKKQEEKATKMRAVAREFKPKIKELDKRAKDLNKEADRLEKALVKQRTVTAKNPTKENKARVKAIQSETRTADRAAKQADKVADKAADQFERALKKAAK